MIDGLYHAEIGFPPEVEKLVGQSFHLLYGPHARRACLDHRFGIPRPPKAVTVTRDKLVEVAFEKGRLDKLVLRFPNGDGKTDLVLVVGGNELDRGVHFVRSLWLNRLTDKHKTLDRSRYQTP